MPPKNFKLHIQHRNNIHGLNDNKKSNERKLVARKLHFLESAVVGKDEVAHDERHDDTRGAVEGVGKLPRGLAAVDGVPGHGEEVADEPFGRRVEPRQEAKTAAGPTRHTRISLVGISFVSALQQRNCAKTQLTSLCRISESSQTRLAGQAQGPG